MIKVTTCLHQPEPCWEVARHIRQQGQARQQDHCHHRHALGRAAQRWGWRQLELQVEALIREQAVPYI